MHTETLDKEAILKARTTKRIVTIEDHSIYNGLGSAAEVLMESGVQTGFRRLGILIYTRLTGSAEVAR